MAPRSSLFTLFASSDLTASDTLPDGMFQYADTGLNNSDLMPVFA